MQISDILPDKLLFMYGSKEVTPGQEEEMLTQYQSRLEFLAIFLCIWQISSEDDRLHFLLSCMIFSTLVFFLVITQPRLAGSLEFLKCKPHLGTDESNSY